MQFSADTSLIEAARRIGPLIRDHSEQAERERRLSPPVLAALHETGLLRMYTPRSLGGLEVDPITRTFVSEEISRYDVAAGWTLCNPLDWAHFCARLPDEGPAEIYGNGGDALIAAQFGRPLAAPPVRGGYRIAGRAPFVSNCYDANWFAMTAVVSGGEDEGTPDMVMVYFPRESGQIIDTWHVLGMRGAGSNDVSVDDVSECEAPAAMMYRWTTYSCPRRGRSRWFRSSSRGPTIRAPSIGSHCLELSQPAFPL